MGKHLRLHGIIKEYKQWIFHGESIERTSVQTDQTVRTSPSISTCDNEADLRDLITDALGINIPTLNESFDGFSSEFQNNGREYDVNKAQRTAERETTLLDDCDIPLYLGCVNSGILDDVRASSWLYAMKSSSLRHTSTRDYNHEIVSANTDVAYRTWMAKYPSALSSFERITNFAKGKRIALFLDYDGTLSPIVDNPDFAFMSIDVRINGLTDLYYARSHGMDIMGPVRESSDDPPNCIRSTDKQGKGVKLFQIASEFLPMIDENWKTVAECVHDVIRNYHHLRLSHGRKVLEVRPVIDWDKGKALPFLLESLGKLSNHDDVLPIYLGNDRTDEDAFKVLREGNLGYGILVSSTPKESIVVIDTSRAAFLHCYPNNGNYGCGLSECN
ncbi:hypothetical protein GOBAR_AA03923 [Gossypium barbadense]|uniref:Trehalose 6-phosphate phosphatase n=1 Tax=Gossypium barbadense TaxID=3634 RepID=A0A2P5YM57_GOSBA|nr:hypothetical protein GOBAR_AA03923 [Gossypium barbadense]